MEKKDNESVFTEEDAGYVPPPAGNFTGGRSEPGPSDNDPHKPVKTPPKPPAGHGKGGQ